MIDALEQLHQGAPLHPDHADALAEALIGGSLPEDQIKAALLSLHQRGETLVEIQAFARALLKRAVVPAGLDAFRSKPILDIVGTGGDGSNSLNISTAAAIVTAAAGQGKFTVVKHGNRAVSSKCGSADVMEALGVPIPIPDHLLAPALAASNFVFLHAQRHHPALAAVAPIRRSLGIRTIFNLVGPIVNPARPTHAILGAGNETTARHLATAASALNASACWGIHSENGWDEATPMCPCRTHVVIPDRKAPFTDSYSAADFNLPACTADDLRGGDAAFNARAIHDLLDGNHSPFRNAVIINSALALMALDIAHQPLEAAALATNAIDTGAAQQTLSNLIKAAKP